MEEEFLFQPIKIGFFPGPHSSQNVFLIIQVHNAMYKRKQKSCVGEYFKSSLPPTLIRAKA